MPTKKQIRTGKNSLFCGLSSKGEKVASYVKAFNECIIKFISFCLIALKEMAYTFGTVYKKFYSKDSPLDMTNSVSVDRREGKRAFCLICKREFNKDDAIVRCPEKDCGEIYHYSCWHVIQGCIRPDCLSTLENLQSITIH